MWPGARKERCFAPVIDEGRRHGPKSARPEGVVPARPLDVSRRLQGQTSPCCAPFLAGGAGNGCGVPPSHAAAARRLPLRSAAIDPASAITVVEAYFLPPMQPSINRLRQGDRHPHGGTICAAFAAHIFHSGYAVPSARRSAATDSCIASLLAAVSRRVSSSMKSCTVPKTRSAVTSTPASRSFAA